MSGLLKLTRTEDKIQKTMDSGKATIYRTRPVKFNNRKKFPVNPHASDIALHIISLAQRSSTLNDPLQEQPSAYSPSWIRNANSTVIRAFR